MGGRSLRTRDKTSAARAEVDGDSRGGILPDTPPSPLFSLGPDPLPFWGFSCASSPGSTLHTCPGLPSPRPLVRPRQDSPPDPPTRVPSRLPRPGSSTARVSSRVPAPGLLPTPPFPARVASSLLGPVSPPAWVPSCPTTRVLSRFPSYPLRVPSCLLGPLSSPPARGPNCAPARAPLARPPLWPRFLSSPVPEGDWTLPPCPRPESEILHPLQRTLMCI